ncbi:MAG: hypothetical protein PHW65_03495, partial [Dehalococcoidales bacterium]|nr:hypothetical protein [Dehalococcoidales bacterium]
MKNSLFRKILAVGATLALVSSFFVAVPVSATPGCNTWGDIDMPDFALNTELGVMDVAPDGTIFLAVWTHPEDFNEDNEIGKDSGDDPYVNDGYWVIKYSTDGGFTWKNTNMPKVYNNDPWMSDVEGMGAVPMAIKVSPMWPSNKNVYVALSDGKVWRLPNAGLGAPTPLNTITQETEDATLLWDMDIWADGSYNYLAVATTLDVFVIKDQLMGQWVDYQLNVDNDHNRIARAVRFAPDFATSELIWAVVAGDKKEHNDALGELDDQLYLVSADSPARWGYVFDAVDFTYYGTGLGKAKDTRFVDMAFDPDYTSALPQLYVAIAGDNPFVTGGVAAAAKIGNLWFVSGEAETTGPGEMESGFIFFEDQALGSVQVNGNTVMVQNAWTGSVYTTTDHGNSWPEAKRSPAGQYWGHLLMSPNYATDKTVYASSFDARWSKYVGPSQSIPYGGISGFYRSTDGATIFDGISL